MENLFNLDFGRWEIVLTSLVPAFINIIAFLYVSIYLHRSRTNYAFANFLLILGTWEIIEGFVRFSRTTETAIFWSQMSWVFALFLVPFGIVFALLFSKWGKNISNYTVFITQFLPAIICSFLVIAQLDSYDMVQSDQWYWIQVPKHTIITSAIYCWISFEGLLMLGLLWICYLKIKTNKIKRKQSFLLALGFSAPVVGGIICEVVFPMVLGINGLPITTSLFTIFSITTLVAIKKYKLFDFSPKHQWDKIIEVMNEGLLILNNEDEIMFANKMFCELSGYTFEEIREKRKSELFFNDSNTKKQIEIFIENRKNNQPAEYEVQLKTKSGEPLWVIMSTSPYVGRNGKTIGSISIQTNINERKKAEAEINKLNEELEERVKKRTSELTLANVLLENETQMVLKASKIIEQKNKDITDSLNYAKLIQNSIIHKKENLEKLLPQSFIINMPLDVVSGDFIRVEKKNNKVLVALADCTGHGIPGAMMSMIGCVLFNDIVNYKRQIKPSIVLELLDFSFNELTKESESLIDGMDVGFCSIDTNNMELNYAGAHRPLYLLRDNILTEIKGDNLSIGGGVHSNKIFTNHHFPLLKNDTLYLFSDGYTDQFGGENEKKFSTKRLKNLLISIQHLTMEEQGIYLKKTIMEWKGSLSQIDDICVLGIKI